MTFHASLSWFLIYVLTIKRLFKRFWDEILNVCIWFAYLESVRLCFDTICNNSSVDQWLAESDVDARMIMQVHDELVVEVAEKEAQNVADKLCELMSSAASLDVDLLVEAGIGDNWDEAH